VKEAGSSYETLTPLFVWQGTLCHTPADCSLHKHWCEDVTFWVYCGHRRSASEKLTWGEVPALLWTSASRLCRWLRVKIYMGRPVSWRLCSLASSGRPFSTTARRWTGVTLKPMPARARIPLLVQDLVLMRRRRENSDPSSDARNFWCDNITSVHYKSPDETLSSVEGKLICFRGNHLNYADHRKCWKENKFKKYVSHRHHCRPTVSPPSLRPLLAILWSIRWRYDRCDTIRASQDACDSLQRYALLQDKHVVWRRWWEKGWRRRRPDGSTGFTLTATK
jgi:hypothetical protein